MTIRQTLLILTLFFLSINPSYSQNTPPSHSQMLKMMADSIVNVAKPRLPIKIVSWMSINKVYLDLSVIVYELVVRKSLNTNELAQIRKGWRKDYCKSGGPFLNLGGMTLIKIMTERGSKIDNFYISKNDCN
jgi:hypothetical protein